MFLKNCSDEFFFEYFCENAFFRDLTEWLPSNWAVRGVFENETPPSKTVSFFLNNICGSFHYTVSCSQDIPLLFSSLKMTESMAITGKNLRIQKFPFRSKFVTYLIETADVEIMQKFHRCCKELYKLAPYFIVDSIEIGCQKIRNEIRIENEKYDVCLHSKGDDISDFFSKIDNVWLTKSGKFRGAFSLAKVKIVRCTASKILSKTDLTYDIFKILTKSGNVEEIAFGNISNPDESYVFLEDILALVPKASSIHIRQCRTNAQTMKKIMEIPWKQKIKKLYYDSAVPDEEDDESENITNFIKVNFDLGFAPFPRHFCFTPPLRQFPGKSNLSLVHNYLS